MNAFWNAIEPWVIGVLWILSLWVFGSIVANNKKIGNWMKSANTKLKEEAEKNTTAAKAINAVDTVVKKTTKS